jgi:hypothetical protein
MSIASKLIKELNILRKDGYDSVTIAQVMEWIRFYTWEAKTARLNNEPDIDKLINEE